MQTRFPSKNKTLISGGAQDKTPPPRIQSAMVGDRYLKALEEHQKILTYVYQNKPEDTERLLVLHLNRAKPDLSAVPN